MTTERTSTEPVPAESTPESSSVPFRPRRSVLFLPASNPRALAKAHDLPADVVILDLEDAVAPPAKPAAREAACAAVVAGGFRANEIVIRCNALDTPWGADDLAAAAAAAPDAVVVPKVSGPADLDPIREALDRAGAGSVAIWPMIETPAAVSSARAIAASGGIGALVVGTNDLAKELRVRLRPGRGGLVPHLAAILLAGRQAGTDVLDGVWNDIRDLEGLAAECLQGVELGFDGKTLIHPGQIEIANRHWAPTDDEIAHAERVIAAFEEAIGAGRGVITVDGRLVENLHVENARRTLATATAIRSLG